MHNRWCKDGGQGQGGRRKASGLNEKNAPLSWRNNTDQRVSVDTDGILRSHAAARMCENATTCCAIISNCASMPVSRQHTFKLLRLRTSNPISLFRPDRRSMARKQSLGPWRDICFAEHARWHGVCSPARAMSTNKRRCLFCQSSTQAA
jgi:hypothetical protein